MISDQVDPFGLAARGQAVSLYSHGLPEDVCLTI